MSYNGQRPPTVEIQISWGCMGLVLVFLLFWAVVIALLVHFF